MSLGVVAVKKQIAISKHSICHLEARVKANMASSYKMLCSLFSLHFRPQSPRSLWPAAGIESSGWLQTRKSMNQCTDFRPFYANSEV